MVERIKAAFDQHGFGLWAVEVPNVAPFIGFVGLPVSSFISCYDTAGKEGTMFNSNVFKRMGAGTVFVVLLLAK